MNISLNREIPRKKNTFFYRLSWPCNLHLGITFLSVSIAQFKGSIFLLIFMKLRLALLNQDLACRFNVPEGLVSRLINEGLPALAFRLSFLVRWPSKEEVSRTLPSLFKPRYSNCRVIIDCTEIFCERARNLTLRALTWLNYKHHNTIKILVGITQSDAVSFVSKAFGVKLQIN